MSQTRRSWTQTTLLADEEDYRATLLYEDRMTKPLATSLARGNLSICESIARESPFYFKATLATVGIPW